MQLQRIAIEPSQIQEDKIVLNNEQLHYLSRVLRLHSGSNFIAMDGQGKWWLAQLGEKRAQIIQELENHQRELSIAVTLIIALPKNGFDEVVRCTTELGVAQIIPVISDRTVLKPSSQKLQRWQKIAKEAAEQSERTIVPRVLEPCAFQAALSSVLEGDEANSSLSGVFRYICAAREDTTYLSSCLQKLDLKQKLDVKNNTYENQWQNSPRIILATGPEGGWTEKEIEFAVDSGFVKVSLGKRILRAITAPIAAMSMIAPILESDRSNLKLVIELNQ